MYKTIFFLSILMTFMFSLTSYSQKTEIEHSGGTYFSKINISYICKDSTEINKIDAALIYIDKEKKYLLAIYTDEKSGLAFDLLNYPIKVKFDEETKQYKWDGEHTAIDLSAFSFKIPAEDLLIFNESKVVLLDVVLIRIVDDIKKEIPITINLKPELIEVYLDFYNIGLKGK